MVLRVLIPVIAVWFTIRLFFSLLRSKKAPTIATLAMLDSPTQFDITSFECFIGRAKTCDICLNFNSVSRRAAIITYSDSEGFKLTIPQNSKKVTVNGIPVDGWAYIADGDILNIGGVELRFLVGDIERIAEESRPRIGEHSIKEAVLLTIFQVLSIFEIVLHYGSEVKILIPLFAVVLIIAEWVYLFVVGFRGNIQIELIGFFLTSIGFSICASAAPNEVLKLFVSIAVGFAMFCVAGIVLKHPELIEKLQYVAIGVAVALFLYNMIFGSYINGARNWIMIGSFSFQPSELIKFVLIFVGGATLINMMQTKKMLLFIGFAFFCIGSLFLMHDFGTASIYFVTMLIIIYMRQGNIVPIIAILAVAAVGVVVIISVMPYVLNRFAAYRHVWENASDLGYQQTRTLIAIASGGFFGLGFGNGNLSAVAASDTDLVFGYVSEEWGMLLGMCVIAMFVLIALYAFKRASRTISAYYSIIACAAAGMFIFQISLNIFGSTDVLPLTGVTIPFVSNGGSSMMASWLILSCIKACGRDFAPRVIGGNAQ